MSASNDDSSSAVKTKAGERFRFSLRPQSSAATEKKRKSTAVEVPRWMQQPSNKKARTDLASASSAQPNNRPSIDDMTLEDIAEECTTLKARLAQLNERVNLLIGQREDALDAIKRMLS